MALKSPIKDTSGPSTTETIRIQLDTSPSPITPTVQPLKPPSNPQNPVTPSSAISSRPPEPPPSTDADVVKIPSYSRWFSWTGIHECEIRFLPEFFDSRSPSKNSRVYMYYRNSIIKMFRDNPSRKLTFTEARKILVGDVGSVRRVFDFLEAWGLINYSGPVFKQPLKWEEKDSKSSGVASSPGGDHPAKKTLESPFPTKRWCNGCKSVCSIACFACDKYDLTLCARCYVRRNYQAGVVPSDFRRVEINEEAKSDWTEKETLHLLEAAVHYGDDWKRVAEHVGGRTEKECVTRFIKLPFGEEFLKHPDSEEVDNKFYHTKDLGDAEVGHEGTNLSSPSKRIRLTPLADASNPIMAQAAFLSALVGVEVAEAAARAAVTALSDVNYRTNDKSFSSLVYDSRHEERDVASNGDTAFNELEGAYVDAEAQLEKEALDVERAISGIIDVQMNEIQEKNIQFEEFDMQMEKERERLQQMKHLLFADQLSLLFHRTAATKMGEAKDEGVGTN